MPAVPPSLDEKYTRPAGRIYLTGSQALVRLAMVQRQRDQVAGLNTAGFISGYRGSPLGGLDQALWKARTHLESNHVYFTPGVNEELAATAVWGTQQTGLLPGARYDGVFAMWYGKGPGVDRCGDVFKHANAAGTARHGGVLLVAGDDHACKSSTLPHQSEHAFDAAMIPVLYPTGVNEILELGLHGFAMSRYSGCYVALKTISETVDSSASIAVDADLPRVVIPADFPMPASGLNIRWPDAPLDQELRLQHDKLYAALAYCRANGLNRVTIDSPVPRLGIIASGKSYLDVLQALEDLGIDDSHAAEIGIRLFKVGMPWPLEPNGIREFAQGLDEILVVEEKRQLIEYQMKEQLYNWRDDVRPRVVGKYDEHGEWEVHRGEWLLPAAGELTPAMIARVIAGRIGRFYTSPIVEERLRFLDSKEAALARPRARAARIPYFCSGCPHNTSTRVPEGSQALAGIGCHYMATWIRPEQTMTFTQMGGEGVPWVGMHAFTRTRHVFANLGDGTYFHSGLLAIRATVSAKVNLTYKILFNDAVAMTGGQPHDGALDVPTITRQLAAEGIHRIAIVTDEPGRYRGHGGLAQGTTIHHRDQLDAVQRALRETPGVTALVYDQVCAAEKRRRRKRGKLDDPARRVFINERVCEGCGDCGDKSNCLSVIPVDTEYGRKRAIDQSTCNKDFSCVKGFCPSFVTVEGGRLRRQAPVTEPPWTSLPEPDLPSTVRPWGMLVTGVGGTGVVTIGALLGVAAHIEGRGVTVLDMTGLAQKGGSVYTHIRIADRPEAIRAVRIAAGEADVLIGCDLVVSASDEAIAKCRSGRTHAIVNADVSATGAQVRSPDVTIPTLALMESIREACGPGALASVEATSMATTLLGDSIATNLFMVGFAWQTGLVPVARESLLKAIELNGTAVESNKSAFEWGRRAAHAPEAVRAFVNRVSPEGIPRDLPASLDDLIERRRQDLVDYQGPAYASRYATFVARVREAEARHVPGSEELATAVARGLYKLMAYKDEYEVARLHTSAAFLGGLASRVEGDHRLVFHLAPPLLSRPDPATGEPRKRAFGPWIIPLLKVLARMKALRGTAFDPFGRTAERRAERALITEYESTLLEVVERLSPGHHALAVEIANLPAQIRGFGHVKARHLADSAERRDALLARFRCGTIPAGDVPCEVERAVA